MLRWLAIYSGIVFNNSNGFYFNSNGSLDPSYLNSIGTTGLFIRGYECKDCTAPTRQVENEAWHIKSNYIGGSFNCDFNGTQGAVAYEQNVFSDHILKEKFRCTSDVSSTTQFWIGSEMKWMKEGILLLLKTPNKVIASKQPHQTQITLLTKQDTA